MIKLYKKERNIKMQEAELFDYDEELNEFEDYYDDESDEDEFDYDDMFNDNIPNICRGCPFAGDCTTCLED